MADSTPLMSQLNPSSIPTNKVDSSSINDSLESYIGDTTVMQILQACFISFAWAFDAQQTFISVFTDAEPTWHCTDNSNNSCSPCNSNSTGSWAWDQPIHSSTVSEWNLAGSGSAVAGMPASSYFLGCLIGGFCLGTLADSILGRKKTLFYACLVMSLSAALAAMSPNIWVYSVLRFLCGFSRATVGGSSLVLSTEIVGKQFRERVSIFGFFCFTLGFLSLPGMAYFNEGSTWRNLYLCTSIPSLVYSFLVYLWIQESPRWLLVRGRRDEAINSIKKIVSTNDNIINSSFSRLVDYESNSDDDDVFMSFKMLWETKWAFRRLLAAMIVGVGLGLVYYGMPLNVGNLGSNLYLSVTFNALAELPSSLLTFFLTSKLNRRCSLLVLTTLSGVFSILCVFVSVPWLKMAVEIFSFFDACTAFNIMLIYTIELFPTCVRNSAVSMIRQAIVLGGVFAPILVVEGRKNNFMSFGVFGIVIGCCGLFIVCLPETRGRTICDTMEEEEKEYKQFTASSDNSTIV